jgi:hypothetical protein
MSTCENTVAKGETRKDENDSSITDYFSKIPAMIIVWDRMHLSKSIENPSLK